MLLSCTKDRGLEDKSREISDAWVVLIGIQRLRKLYGGTPDGTVIAC